MGAHHVYFKAVWCPTCHSPPAESLLWCPHAGDAPSRAAMGLGAARQRQVSGLLTFSPQQCPGRKQFRKPGADLVTDSNTCQGPEGGCDPSCKSWRFWGASRAVGQVSLLGAAASKWVTGLPDAGSGFLPALVGHCGDSQLPLHGCGLQIPSSEEMHRLLLPVLLLLAL